MDTLSPLSLQLRPNSYNIKVQERYAINGGILFETEDISLKFSLNFVLVLLDCLWNLPQCINLSKHPSGLLLLLLLDLPSFYPSLPCRQKKQIVIW